MRVRQTLRPGDPGTKKLVTRYGDRLLCVRHRHDAAGETRYTTVELVVDAARCVARAPRSTPRPPLDPDAMVGVRIFFREAELRERAKAAGAIWRPRHKLWDMPWRTARALGLVARTVSNRPPA